MFPPSSTAVPARSAAASASLFLLAPTPRLSILFGHHRVQSLFASGAIRLSSAYIGFALVSAWPLAPGASLSNVMLAEGASVDTELSGYLRY